LIAMGSLEALADWPLTDRDRARGLVEAIQAAVARAGLSWRSPPPEPDTCCGRGCNGCVWEGYFTALSWWRDQALQQLAERADSAGAPP
jgi:Oxidoreductase-like protein, N-terminal